MRDEIKASAPSDTGKYSKSWTVKTIRETSSSLGLLFILEINISLPTLFNSVMQSVVEVAYLQDHIL